jgi:hypothetical protein
MSTTPIIPSDTMTCERSRSLGGNDCDGNWCSETSFPGKWRKVDGQILMYKSVGAIFT